MYPSTYHNNSNPSFTSTYIKPKMFSSTYSYNSNNTNLSKTPQEHYCLPSSSSSFQLLSPDYITLEDGTISNEILQQAENMIICDDHSIHNTNNIAIHEQVSSLQSDIGKCNNNNGEDHDDGLNKPNNSSTKRRSSNDRHSKINTAQGPRDRRMRLSLDVAKRFFKLQDMLGFEKASNTVEWLLMKSEPNIQELSSFKGVSNSASSTSQYEPLSENIDGQSAKSFSSSNHKEKRKGSTGLRKSSYLFRPLAKETREMARKRARERTLDKSSKLGCISGGADQFSEFRPCLDQSLHQDVNCFGSSMIDPPEEASFQFQSKQGILGGYYSLMTGNWNPSFFFNNQPTGVLPQEHQLNDFQMIGNLWEGNNY